MQVLGLLERRAGAGIRDLVAALALPRTTTDRIVNSLEAHAMVRGPPPASIRSGRTY